MMAAAWPVIRRAYRLGSPADELAFARTVDGWDLALHRYRPAVEVAGREPVVLCHGMLSNRFNVDLDERTSLARYLRARGFDAWVMELRGHGLSRRAPGGGRARRFDWNLDDHIQRDLPAVLSHVRRETGAARVHYFGHSMGGMLLYGACALEGIAESIRSAVLSDAPATFAPLRTSARVGRLYGRIFPAVPPALVLPVLGPVVFLAPGLMEPRYGIGDRTLMLRLLSNAIIPWGSSRTLLQFCDMLEAGRFASADGRVDYESGAGRIDFPLLVLSAPRKLMDERAVAAGYERAVAAEKRYVRLGRAWGFARDYTHSNLLLAESSPVEVHPLVSDWMEANSISGLRASGAGAVRPAPATDRS